MKRALPSAAVVLAAMGCAAQAGPTTVREAWTYLAYERCLDTVLADEPLTLLGLKRRSDGASGALALK